MGPETHHFVVHTDANAAAKKQQWENKCTSGRTNLELLCKMQLAILPRSEEFLTAQ